MDERDAGSRTMPTCPLCSGHEWQQEEGKLDSAWGLTAHRVVMLVCQTCGNVLLFYKGNTIFDFD